MSGPEDLNSILNNLEIPHFEKKKDSESSRSRFLQITFIAFLTLFLLLGIVFSFRYLIGTRSDRVDMMSRIQSASDNRKSHLLLEWMSYLEAADSSWKPTAFEQQELLHLVLNNSNQLKEDKTSTALLALHVAGWGPAVGLDSSSFTLLKNAAQSDESKMALGLYLARQLKDLSVDQVSFALEMSKDKQATLRKISTQLLALCFSNDDCKKSLILLLQDSDEELRWNAAFVGLKSTQNNINVSSQLDSVIQTNSALEIQQLYEKIKSFKSVKSESGFSISKFDNQSLSVFIQELLTLLSKARGTEFLSELRELQKTHPDLRLRNEFLIFLNKGQQNSSN